MFKDGRGTFTPDKTKRHEKLIAQHVLAKYGHQRLEGPLKVYIDFYFKGQNRGDIDNYAKTVLDGMRTLFNDRQVKDLFCRLRTGMKDCPERTEILVVKKCS